MASKKLFTYWEGHKPDYISLCEEIIVKKTAHTYEYVAVTPHNLCNYLNDVPASVYGLEKIAHRADYIRCSLLEKFGGVWLDLDQVLLTDLSHINELLNSYDYVTYEWAPQCPSIGFIAAQANCGVLIEWKRQMEHRMTSNAALSWAGLGYELLYPVLQKAIRESNVRYYAFDARTSFAPWSHEELQLFFQQDVLSTNTLQSVMLYNSQFPDWFKSMTRNDILSSNMFIAELFKANL